MRRFALVLTLVLALFAAPAAEAASGTLERVVKNGELRVGMSGEQPPFNFVAKSGDLMGYEVDLATLLAEAMEVELKLVRKPFGQLLAALKKGEVDMVMSGMTMTPARNLEVAFVGPYLVSGKSFLTKSATLAAVTDMEQIDPSKVRLAVLAGSTSQRFVERNLVDEIQLTKTDNYDAAVKLLLEDTVDAVVADMPICVLSVLRHGDHGLAASVEPLTIEPIGLALPPGDSLMLNMVENYVGAMDAVGVLELLEIKWFDDAAWLVHLP